MNPTFDAVLRSWPFEPWVLASLVLTSGVYLRGWLTLHRRDRARWPRSQPIAFGVGIATLFLALASPIEPFTSLLLQVHMVQHVMLTMIAPPLFWLGAPLFPMLLGLPRPIRVYWVVPLFRSRTLRRVLETAARPLAAWVLFTVTIWSWHVPPIYERALASVGWHYLQHLCFLVTALLFWYPVIRPYPSKPAWSPWLLIPYLILSDVQNTLLSAVFTFADHPLYNHYAVQPRLGNLSPLEDQAAAGVVMWVPGSIVYLVALFAIGVRLLFGSSGSKERKGEERLRKQPHLRAVHRLSALPLIEPVAFDVLRVPLIGHLLRWRHARLTFQIPLVLLAAVIVYDGFCGPQIGAMNLAGVLPWIHWRGLVVLGLLVAGNVFCMGCPFMLPRTLARRWLPRGWNWPRRLRNKWLAVLLLAWFFWAYEAFSLWDSPVLTAWIILAYFATAFVVDGFFQGASFCKYVCPIGQFNFVQSLVSPVEIKVRGLAVCASCQTKDCIKGSGDIPGCELHLYQPRKSSNMDCTFCLDCIHACPHDNIGILAVTPGSELWRDALRSGIGRFGKRPDLAALVVVLVFGAFVNAAGMIAPVLEWRDQVAGLLGERSSLRVISLFFILGLILLPVSMVAVSAVVCHAYVPTDVSRLEIASRFSFSLVPLGFSMWLAHYCFHFFASWRALAPALQRFGSDLGYAVLGEPEWALACCQPVAAWLPKLEILLLDCGLLLSLYSGYRIALSQSLRESQAFKILAPWAILIVLLFTAGVWIVLQPMQMRGTVAAVG